jgi:hypothetical protein
VSEAASTRTQRRTREAPGPIAVWASRQPRLLAAEPLLRLVADLDRVARERSQYTPGDPAAAALTRVVLQLQETIEEAADIGTVMDVDTAAQVLDLSVSMVTHLCRKGPEAGGLDAQKLGGEWRISRASVEAQAARRN